MPTKIIILLIALQVVAGLMAKRKAKQKAAEAREGGADARAGRKPQARPAVMREEESEEGDEESAPAGYGKAESAKDIMSQLARELGLEIPGLPQRPQKPRTPHPARNSNRKPEASVSKPGPAAARPVEPAKRVPDAAKRPAERPKYWDDASSAARKAAAKMVAEHAHAMEAPAPRSTTDIAMEGLGDAESIRRAFILKTILDKPLALQPRIPGGN